MKKYVIGLLFILLLTFTAAICTASTTKRDAKLLLKYEVEYPQIAGTPRILKYEKVTLTRP